MNTINPCKRGKTYRVLGLSLITLGILWNLAGTTFGTVPANAALGFIGICAGIFYWLKGRRLSP